MTNILNLFHNRFDLAGAHFEDDRQYRYLLWRNWDELKPKIMFIGLNPSTANEEKDDPTIRRVCIFAKKWGFGGVYMANLFPFVTAYPKELEKNKRNIDKNDEIIQQFSRECHMVVFAWGNFKEAETRGQIMRTNFPHAFALEINKNGSPKHPLYVKGDIMPIKYNYALGGFVTPNQIMEKTIGEKRVRTEFNPSQNDAVSQIKQKTAELINLTESLKDGKTADEHAPERGRLVALAMTAYEEAAMWAVKAATI